jgi:hypothetical protein
MQLQTGRVFAGGMFLGIVLTMMLDSLNDTDNASAAVCKDGRASTVQSSVGRLSPSGIGSINDDEDTAVRRKAERLKKRTSGSGSRVETRAPSQQEVSDPSAQGSENQQATTAAPVLKRKTEAPSVEGELNLPVRRMYESDPQFETRLENEREELAATLLARAFLSDEGFAENEASWDKVFGQNQIPLKLNEWLEMERNAAELYSTREKTGPMTMQKAYEGVRRAMNLSDTVGLNRKKRQKAGVVPAFACPSTAVDFPIMLHLLGRGIDTGVEMFVFTINGHTAVPTIFLRAVQLALGSERIRLFVHQENAGVSRSWNNALVSAFETTKDLEFVVVSNADVVPVKGKLGLFATDTYRRYYVKDMERDAICVNRLGHFALFLVTRLGYRKLGKFDESLFPAYGEDVEYHIRAVSAGVGGPKHFGKTTENLVDQDFYHLHSTNLKGKLRSLNWNQHAMTTYVQQKWGVAMGSVTDYVQAHPYRYPWGDCRIPHNNSWIFDPAYRQCLSSGGHCHFNTGLLSQLQIPADQTPSPCIPGHTHYAGD